MIPRIKHIEALQNLTLRVSFDDGRVVDYNVGEDVKEIPSFKPLADEIGLFNAFQLDESRTCVYWSNQIDLASDTIYEYGKLVDFIPLAAEDPAQSNIVGSMSSIEVVKVVAMPNMTLMLTFSNGENRLFDASKLDGPVFEPLKDVKIFENVCIEFGAPSWMNGSIDVAPEYLYEHSVATDQAYVVAETPPPYGTK